MMWTKSLSSYFCMHKSSHDLWITWVYKGLYHYLVSVSELFMHWRHNIKSKVWLLGFSGLFINSSRCNATRASGTSFWEYDTWPRAFDGFYQANMPVSPLLEGALWLSQYLNKLFVNRSSMLGKNLLLSLLNILQSLLGPLCVLWHRWQILDLPLVSENITFFILSIGKFFHLHILKLTKFDGKFISKQLKNLFKWHNVLIILVMNRRCNIEPKSHRREDKSWLCSICRLKKRCFASPALDTEKIRSKSGLKCHNIDQCMSIILQWRKSRNRECLKYIVL